MKNLIITTVLALGVAAPAVAQSQLERSLNVEAGVYSISELARLKAASTEQQSLHSDKARAIFAQIAEASKEDE